jgi:hypothetical protein
VVELDIKFSGIVRGRGSMESIEASISHPVRDRYGLFRCDVRISWPEEIILTARAQTEVDATRIARMQLLTQLVALGARDVDNRDLDPFEILRESPPVRAPSEGRRGILCMLDKDGKGGALLRMFDAEQIASSERWECVRPYTERHFGAERFAQSPMDPEELEATGATVLARLMAFEGI